METHLSAYITIRKKFIKNPSEIVKDDTNDSVKHNNISVENVNIKIQMENGLLKQEINDVKTNYANLELMHDEIEMKNGELTGLIASFEEKLDVEQKASQEIKDELIRLKSENEELNKLILKKENIAIQKQEELEKSSLLNKKLEKANKRLEKTKLMVETEVKSKDQIMINLRECNKKLKDNQSSISCDNCDYTSKDDANLKVHQVPKHSDESAPSTSKCGSCDFVSDDENCIDNHISSNHKHTCVTCNLSFKSESKLDRHMCRTEVQNPACGEYYMKNWFISNGCTRIFSSILEKEVLFLHSQQCIDGVNGCQDMLSYYHMVKYDGEVWHAPLSDYFFEGKISWDKLQKF